MDLRVIAQNACFSPYTCNNAVFAVGCMNAEHHVDLNACIQL